MSTWTRALAVTGAAVGTGTAVVAATAARVHWSERRALRVQPRPAAALVVFGGQVYPHTPALDVRIRLDHAADLWRQGVAPVIVVSGGVDRREEYGPEGLDEVTVMTRYLIESGVPEAALLPGRPGDNTRMTVHTVAGSGFRDVVAVTSSWHAYRVERESARSGLRVQVSAPDHTPDRLVGRVYLVRFGTELVAATWYALPRAVTARVPIGAWRHRIPHLLIGRRGARPIGQGSACGS